MSVSVVSLFSIFVVFVVVVVTLTVVFEGVIVVDNCVVVGILVVVVVVVVVFGVVVEKLVSSLIGLKVAVLETDCSSLVVGSVGTGLSCDSDVVLVSFNDILV